MKSVMSDMLHRVKTIVHKNGVRVEVNHAADELMERVDIAAIEARRRMLSFELATSQMEMKHAANQAGKYLKNGVIEKMIVNMPEINRAAEMADAISQQLIAPQPKGEEEVPGRVSKKYYPYIVAMKDTGGTIYNGSEYLRFEPAGYMISRSEMSLRGPFFLAEPYVDRYRGLAFTGDEGSNPDPTNYYDSYFSYILADDAMMSDPFFLGGDKNKNVDSSGIPPINAGGKKSKRRVLSHCSTGGYITGVSHGGWESVIYGGKLEPPGGDWNDTYSGYSGRFDSGKQTTTGMLFDDEDNYAYAFVNVPNGLTSILYDELTPGLYNTSTNYCINGITGSISNIGIPSQNSVNYHIFGASNPFHCRMFNVPGHGIVYMAIPEQGSIWWTCPLWSNPYNTTNPHCDSYFYHKPGIDMVSINKETMSTLVIDRINIDHIYVQWAYGPTPVIGTYPPLSFYAGDTKCYRFPKTKEEPLFFEDGSQAHMPVTIHSGVDYLAGASRGNRYGTIDKQEGFGIIEETIYE